MPCVAITLCTFDADTVSSRISPTKYSLVLNLQVNTSHPQALHINFWDQHKSNTAYLILMQCLMRAKVREPFYMTTASLTANMLYPGDKAFRQLPAFDCSGCVLAHFEPCWNQLGCFPHLRGSPGVLSVVTPAGCSVLQKLFFFIFLERFIRFGVLGRVLEPISCICTGGTAEGFVSSSRVLCDPLGGFGTLLRGTLAALWGFPGTAIYYQKPSQILSGLSAPQTQHPRGWAAIHFYTLVKYSSVTYSVFMFVSCTNASLVQYLVISTAFDPLSVTAIV